MWRNQDPNQLHLEPLKLEELVNESNHALFGDSSERRASVSTSSTGSSDKSMLPGQHDFTFETDPDAPVYVPPEPNFGPPEYLEGWEPQEPEEDQDDIFEEDEEELAAKSAKKKRKRKSDGDSDEPEEKRAPEWDLLSFELLDLDEIEEPRKQSRRRKKKRSSAATDDGEGTSRKKQSRRGSRGRRKKRETVSAAELFASPPKSSNGASKPKPAAKSEPKAEPAPAPAAAATQAGEKKPSFFARLFGIK